MGDLFSRRLRSREIRREEAENAFERNRVEQVANDDESQYADFRGSFYKPLPQDDRGFVDPQAYRQLVRAVTSTTSSEYEAIPLDPNIPDAKQRGLANPQGGIAFSLEGPDPAAVTLPPAPDYESAETAAEMVELYWQALARDVPFTEYDSNGLIGDAVDELNTLEDLNVLRDANGDITRQTVFRGNVFGAELGPLVPQFYLRDTPFNVSNVPAENTTFKEGEDFMLVFDEWLEVQRGLNTSGNVNEVPPRLMATLRDMAAYVRADRLVQSYLFATQQLLTFGTSDPAGILDQGNPYRFSDNQGGFVTFGLEHINTLLGEVIRRCLQAAWYQKWQVHRRLRPEVFGGRIDDAFRELIGEEVYPANKPAPEADRKELYKKFVSAVKQGLLAPIDDQVLLSEALERTFLENGSFLLPQAYPEGSPTHPSYPAGHATAAGACGTLMKAFFNESVPFETIQYPDKPGIVQANKDGSKLIKYTEDDASELTVGTEINKLTFKHATARSYAGVHYRSDNFQGILLGEDVAIQLLQEQASVFNEDFSFTLRKFDGSTVVIS